ncbi:McrB family protein [Pseudoduganella armeniaca]|uniref:AAA family ATPase n=1 Tax=Pseudoduganella armeniaca TaxID=2072590 RepID=A0A2R4CG67_9BURK|nr:AAA family ATPase [Pseudoduganella armeniaca]AVR98532.1 AAA family ATPase [Pseudoduganella armeniaca]
MIATAPHQLILFGPPGTSKSYTAKHVKVKELGAQLVPVAFHPEFTYGEFVARLLPLSVDGKVQYNVHAGPFLRALALACADAKRNVVLLIDEINRGNCAEIFGDIFQLLDRDDDGSSSYEIVVSELTICALRQELAALGHEEDKWSEPLKQLIAARQLKLPANFYLIGTMNTSDESIYFMDSAFKRRWNFEFLSSGFDNVPAEQCDAPLFKPHDQYTLKQFVDALNKFIVENCSAPKLDDKLVGPWFIKAQKAPLDCSADLVQLNGMAPQVAIYYDGATNSRKFEQALLAFAAKMGGAIQQDIHKLAGYQPSQGPSVLKHIAADPASHYYKSRKKFDPPSDGTMLIEDFVKKLESYIAEQQVAPRIAKGDVVGKLFLYLWDNVFDRDKAPIYNRLKLPRNEMRTFGQFVAHADDFIALLCNPPSDKAAAKD